MKKLILLLLPALFFVISCESGNEPIENDQIGRRDYIWKIDTLNTYENLMNYSNIWGANPTDVWIVGDGGLSDQTIIRYNGVSWNIFNNGGRYYCRSIFGFAENDVWIGGYRGRVYHYDGNELTLFQTLPYQERETFSFLSMFGTSPQNIISVGQVDNTYGAVARYNGEEWQIEYVADFASQFGEVDMGIRSNSEYFIWGVHHESEYDGGLFSYKNRELSELKLGYYNDLSNPIVNILGGEAFFSWQGRMYVLEDGEFSLYLDLSYIGNDLLPRVWGRNKNDFLFSNGNNIYHYNGIDVGVLVTTDDLDYLDIRDAAVFENDIFLLVLNHTNALRFVMHGILE